MVLSQVLNAAASKSPNSIAILDLGKGISFTDLRKRVGQLSYLYQSEIGHGKRVAFLSQNNTAVIQSFLAFSNAGIVSVFLSPKESDEQILQAIKELEISHLAISSDQVQRVSDLVRTFGVQINVVEIERKKGGEYDPAFSPPPEHPLKETNSVLIVRAPEQGEATKYILFNHKQIIAATNSIRKLYQLAANDRFFTTMSWAQPFSLIHNMIFPLFNGACCAVNPQLEEPEKFIEYLAKQQINRFVDSAKYFQQLLALCTSTHYSLPGVRSITVGLGTLPISANKKFTQMKVPVLHCFGKVENLWTICMNDKAQYGSVDQSMSCLTGVKYKVLDLAGDELTGDIRVGPLAVTGDMVMKSYFHPKKELAEKATRNKIRGTWLYTGHIANMMGNDEEGYRIQILGNESEVIRVGTSYLAADRLDAATKGAPGILDAAGFVLNKLAGPVFACAIVKKVKILKEEEIHEHCKAHLPANLQPKFLFFVDDIPRDEFGNVNRKLLQRMFSDA